MRVLAPDRRITFVTDIHLGDGSYTDQFQKKDQPFLNFLDDAAGRSDAIVVMGDCFDLLQCPEPLRIYAAHRRVVHRMQDLALRIPVVFLRGNHDYDVAIYRLIRGALMENQVMVGEDIRVEHGDRFDPFGDLPMAGRFHNFMERLTRSFLRMPIEEHDDLGNRLGHWLGHKLALVCKGLVRSFTYVGWKRRARKIRRFVRYWSRCVWGDCNELVHRIRHRLARMHQVRVLVCGHSHVPGDICWGEKRYINVGSWAMRNSQYAYWDGHDFAVRDWLSGRQIQDEYFRPLLGLREPDYVEWFNRYHRSLLNFHFDRQDQIR